MAIRRPGSLSSSTALLKPLCGVRRLCVFLLAICLWIAAEPQAQTITLATGGGSISADTTGGTYTALTGPVYTETSTGAVDPGTFILNAPSGFVFDTGGVAPTVRVNRVDGGGLFSHNINGLDEGDTIPVTRTATTLSITITDTSSGSVKCSLTWQNVRICPAAGTPLASGNITKSGTAPVAGVTAGVTSFGTITEVHGIAAALAMAVQPSATAVAGVAFAQQPQVGVVDQFGNVVTSNNSAVVTAARNAGAGTLQGTLTDTVSSGLAVFSDLNHRVAGGITIAFSSPGLSGVTSSSIIITPAAADRLIFVTEPGNAFAGAPFGTQPVIRTEDPFGNASSVGLPSNLPVTMSLTAGTGVLLGTTALDIGTAGGNGTVTYTDLQIDVVGAGKQLTASASGLTSAVSASFPVGMGNQIITFAPIPDKTYGDAPFPVSAVASSGLPVTLVVESGPATISGNVVTITGVGTVTIRASQPGDANFNPAPDVTRTFVVNKATLTITAEDKTKLYGDPVPALTFTYSGFVNGETSANLDSLPTVSTTATDISPAGTYPIDVSGATAANYIIVHADGMLTITKGTLTITAHDKTKAYGAPVPAFTASYSGFLNGDTVADLDSPLVISSSATAASNVGTYAITPSGASDANYTIIFQAGTLTITQVGLTITANDKTKVYGAPLPAFTASYVGFVNGDTAASLQTPPTFTCTATSASPIGTYPITVSGAASPNYLITYEGAQLTINRAPLQIRADNKSVVFGETLPALTVTYSGFVNGDTVASLSNPVQLSTTATQSSPLGRYAITVTGATADNYIITFTNGTLAIIGRRVDLIVLYTDAARAAAGGSTIMRSQIFDAVRQVNDCFANSLIDVDLRLVYTAAVAYTETGNIDTDLTRLKEIDDGYLEVAHTNRSQFGSDLVVLVEENTGTNESAGYTMTVPAESFRDSAFAVIQRAAMRTNFALAHELGHIFGCAHDIDHVTSPGSFDYSHGYSFVAGGTTYRTVMAEGAGTRIPYFSNPSIEFLGIPTGVVGAANNALTIRSNTAIVAAFGVELSIVEFTSISVIAREADTTVSLTAERTGAFDDTAAVRYTTRGISAVEGLDYVAEFETLTFLPGEDLKTIEITLLNDSAFETNELVQVVLMDGTNAVIGLEAVANITIEDEEVGFMLGQKSGTVMENGGSITANVLRTGDPSQEVTIDYQTRDGVALAGQDFVGLSGTLTFASGVTNLSVPITISNDVLVERNEAFSLILTNPVSGSQIIGTNSMSITIAEDDVGLALGTNAVIAVENGNATVTIIRSGNITNSVSAQIATSNGTASSGSDYVAVATNVVFGAGVTNRSFSIPIVNNTVWESDETFQVLLQNPVGASLPGYTNATVTIRDNDSSFTFTTNAVTVSEAKGSVVVPVRRTGASLAAGSVRWQTAPGTAAATADYTTAKGMLSFAVGETNKNVTIALKNDTLVEAGEQFSLYLTNSAGESTLGEFPTVAITIADNDSRLSWETDIFYVMENAGAAVLGINRTGALTETNSVSYTITASSARTTDYIGKSGKLKFLPGATNATITIPLIDDALVETNESFTVRLSSPNGGALLLGTNTARVVILEDQVGFSFGSPSYSASENAGSLNVPIVRRGKTNTAATVNFQTSPGTATSGVHYGATNGTLSFSAGVEVQNVGIVISDDTLAQQNKTFSLTLSNPSGAVIIGNASATITILEDDSELSFSTNQVAAAEYLKSMTLTVVRTGGTNFPATVDFLTADGTATGGDDYVTTNGMVTFLPGVAKKTITLPLRNDAAVEGDESFSVILTNLVGAESGAYTVALAAIRDNDSVIGLATNITSVAENARTIGLRVTRTGGVIGPASVRFLTSSGSALMSTDFRKAAGTLSFKAGETNKMIYVNLENDNLVEGSETFVMTLSAPTSESVLGTNSATVTILDDDFDTGGDVTTGELSLDISGSKVRVRGPLGSAVRVEKSIDLASWETFAEVVLSDQPEFEVDLANDSAHGFYRALPVEAQAVEEEPGLP